MKEILYNLALIDATNFCVEHGIDCSGTYLRKVPRGFTYELYKENTGQVVVTTTFHKNSLPTHTYSSSLLIKN